jgi:hypothetical protein
METAVQPSDGEARWSRRSAIVAMLAALCGCKSNQYARDTSPRSRPSIPPSAPDDGPPDATGGPESALVSPAVARAIEHVLRQPSDHPRAAVLDFSAHSSAPRFHLVDRATRRVLQSFRVSHGHGSEGKRDDGYAEVFSNVPNSNASSLGLYRTGETYISEVYPGLAMRLDGLSPTNSNARSRFIVVHAAKYMEPESWSGKKTGRPGRSDGCFVFSKADRDVVVSSLQGGALIYAIHEKQ